MARMVSSSLGRLSTATSSLFLCDMQEGFRKLTSHFIPVVQTSSRLLQAARVLNMPVVATEQYPKGLGPSVPELGLKEHDVKIFEKTCFTMVSGDVESESKILEFEHFSSVKSFQEDTNDGDGTVPQPTGLGPSVPELGLKNMMSRFLKRRASRWCLGMLKVLFPDYVKQSCPDLKSIVLCGIEAHACIFQTSFDLLEKGYEVHLVVDAISSRNPVDRMFALRRLEKAGCFLTTSEGVVLQLVTDAKHPQFRAVQKLIKDPSPDSGLLQNFPKV